MGMSFVTVEGGGQRVLSLASIKSFLFKASFGRGRLTKSPVNGTEIAHRGWPSDGQVVVGDESRSSAIFYRARHSPGSTGARLAPEGCTAVTTAEMLFGQCSAVWRWHRKWRGCSSNVQCGPFQGRYRVVPVRALLMWMTG